ncbi:hypothetical protein F5B18DRAFT_642602 [Nemania serpens]|nr:hypothetical protein F5B18DRAFT_642602 [Nemania serpens]
MKFSMTLSAGLALAGLTTAAPLTTREAKTAAQIIAEIAPTSLTCADTAECRTNVQAAPFLIKAMSQYGLGSPGQIAAVLALTAFESQDYKYKHNIDPGRPGQGTSNMQQINFNAEYASSFPELKGKVAAIGAATSTDAQNKILALVTEDQYNFGSGPWYLKNKCTPDVVSGLEKATDDAFAAYIQQCVGVPGPVAPARLAYWARAKTAFGL